MPVAQQLQKSATVASATMCYIVAGLFADRADAQSAHSNWKLRSLLAFGGHPCNGKFGINQCTAISAAATRVPNFPKARFSEDVCRWLSLNYYAWSSLVIAVISDSEVVLP